MSQDEILKYLKKAKKTIKNPADIRELLINIPIGRPSMSRSCKKLRECGEVRWKTKKVQSHRKFLYYL